MKRPSRIIFIDPGTSFGWAQVTPEGEEPEQHYITTGAKALPTDPGNRVKEFWIQLDELVKPKQDNQDLHLAWEEAAFSGFGRADRMYGMWEGLLILFCELNNIPYSTLNVATIKAYARKHGFYNTKPPKPKQRKGEDCSQFEQRVTDWTFEQINKAYDKKPRSRPEWTLSSSKKLQEHESDARWGLECLLERIKTDGG